MKKIGVVWVVTLFLVGILLGGSVGALYVSWNVTRFEADAITQAVAESALGLLPLVVALRQEGTEERLNLFESGARAQLNGNVVSLHTSLPMLSGLQRRRIADILFSIANKREKLGLGRFDSPPKSHIEDILSGYSE